MANHQGGALSKVCGVCQNEYDEEKRCPRILECFHTLCTECIRTILKENVRRCPFCGQSIQSKCITDIRVNEGVLNLTLYIKFLMSAGTFSFLDVDVTDSAKIDNPLETSRETTVKHLTQWQDAKDQLETTMKKFTEIKNNFQTAQSDFRDTVLSALDDLTTQTEEKKNDLTNVIVDLEESFSEARRKMLEIQELKTTLDAGSLEPEAYTEFLFLSRRTNAAFEEWLKNFKVFLSNKEIIAQMQTKEHEKMQTKMAFVTNLLKSIVSKKKESSSIPLLTVQKAYPLKMTPEKLQELSEPVKCMLGRGKIYVVHQDKEGKRLSSKIYINDDQKLCFSYLREERLPYNVHLLEYDELMVLSDPTSRLVFLEIGARDCTLGRLYIRFTSDSAFNKQFTILCSGIMGPSYANSKFLELYKNKHRWHWIRCGDYERNNGTGGKALVAGLGVLGEHTGPCVAGTVENWWGLGIGVASQFIIHLKSSAKMISADNTGLVEEGLAVLRKAACQCPDVRNIGIIDCGIVLPTSPSE